jgi:hypothetical protein
MRLLGIMRVVSAAELSGFLSVARGIAEANQPVLVALYLGMICAAITISLAMRRRDKKALPPGWLWVATLVVGLIPVVLLWIVETMMIRALGGLRNGVVPNASLIETLLFTVIGGGIGVALLVLLSAILRVSVGKEAKWKSLVAVSLVLTTFIVGAIAFHMRNAWIDGLYQQL